MSRSMNSVNNKRATISNHHNIGTSGDAKATMRNTNESTLINYAKWKIYKKRKQRQEEKFFADKCEQCNADEIISALQSENRRHSILFPTNYSPDNGSAVATTTTSSSNINFLTSGHKSKSCESVFKRFDGFEKKNLIENKRYNEFLPQTINAVSIDDHVAICNDDKNKITIKIKYEDQDQQYQNLPSRQLATKSKVNDIKGLQRHSRKFNEKAIDVPEDFERAAYGTDCGYRRELLKKKFKKPIRQLKPFFDYQEDWIKIDEEDSDCDIQQNRNLVKNNQFFPLLTTESDNISRHSAFELDLNNMGSINSRTAKLIKVHPQNDGKVPVKSENVAENDVTEPPEGSNFIRVKSCSDNFEMPQRDDEKSASLLRKTLNIPNNSLSPLFSNSDHSSTIDINSILHRTSEYFITKNSSSKSFLYSDINQLDSVKKYENTKNENLSSSDTKININKNVFFAKKSNNISMIECRDEISSNSSTPVKSSQSCSNIKLCHRLGGSFQNLLRINDTKVKQLSASEVNLSSTKPLNNAPNARRSLRFTYCPSVLFSQRQNAWAAKKKNQTGKITVPPKSPKTCVGKAWRKYMTLGLLRKINIRIQNVDDSFFERFGSRLQEKLNTHEEQFATPLAPLPTTDEVVAEKAVITLRSIGEEGENEDSGNETLPDTDSEPEDLDLKDLHIVERSVGWNLEELYEEILYEIIHNIGANPESSDAALFSYAQDAFKIPDVRHEQLLEAARTKEAPELRLNVEVIEAKDLVPKDPNGLSDPFVTMYIASIPTHRYNTSVKSETLNPTWEEHFSLPISENGNEDNLVIEVWDFDPAETVREKMNKLFDVKGVKGFRKLMKEIAVTASNGKHDNELIGIANVSLKSIPAAGLVMWYNLDKKNRTKSRGLIKIRLTFSSEKNNRVAAQEHRHLLRILLMHELENSKVAPHWWAGKFSTYGEEILTQHIVQSGLSQVDIALTQWTVYAGVHPSHPLAFSLFDSLLDKIIRPIQSRTISDDEINVFWEATKKLLPSCFGYIKKIRKKMSGDKSSLKTLIDALSILSKIAMLEPPEGTDLFPAQQYGWIKRTSDEPNWDIRGALRDAVTAGANDWFNQINVDTEVQNGTDEAKLQHIVKLIQLIRSDLQKALEYYDKTFQEIMNFQYARTLYACYEGNVADYMEPIVESISKNLKRIDIPHHDTEKIEAHQEINMGTALFELYLVVKKFSLLGSALSQGETNFKINKYHNWFTPGVLHWLQISVFKALTRIEKAIELDQLVPVDESVKYSSSAVDTRHIFNQIKIFWQQLDWPDIESSYMFVAKIIDDICQCCIYYARKMSERVEGLGEVHNVYEKKFEVTREWCLAINNIDYIRQNLAPFIKELGIGEIISKLGDARSQQEADRCSETIKNVVDNAIDNETNKILELVETVAKKMSPMMRKFLLEGAEFLHQDSNSLDRLMMYLEESLKTLNMELNEDNFNRILDAIWTELANVLYDLVQSNLDKQRPPAFFSNLRDALKIMIESFKGTEKCENSPERLTLQTIERTLELNAYETAELIHQYYLERYKEQLKATSNPFGLLTVKACFKDNNLEIEVMSARNLVSTDTNGLCDPFVRIHFLPEEKFVGVAKPKTSTQTKTLFPLFDEKFVINLSPEQRSMSNGLILFSVKDKDLFGMSNQYVAESFLVFKDIVDGSRSVPEQTHLTLTRPTQTDTECIRVLEYRQGDKQAKEFLKKLKQKVNNQA